MDEFPEERLQTTSEVLPEVYGDLRKVAGRLMAKETVGHSLQPTALLNEACVRMLKPDVETQWSGKSHFAAVVVEVMRRILVESARRKKRQKRGGGMVRSDIDPAELPQPSSDELLLTLDDALTQLAAVNAGWAEVVKLRYFLNMTIPEAAQALGVSPRTADAWWAAARDWLKQHITLDVDDMIVPSV